MWSGRFREPLDPYFDNWQRSLKFDWQLLEQEIVASKAHAVALQAANILTATELATIRQALDSIWAQFLDPKLGGPGWVCDNPDAEDIHHFVELQLSARIGDLALKAPHRPQPQRTDCHRPAPLRPFQHRLAH